MEAREISEQQLDNVHSVTSCSENGEHSINTVKATWAKKDTPKAQPNIDAMALDLTEALEQSWVYRRNNALDSSRDSVFSRDGHSMSWSCLSVFSCAEISNISVISLPITINELENSLRSTQTWVANPVTPVPVSPLMAAMDKTNPLIENFEEQVIIQSLVNGDLRLRRTYVKGVPIDEVKDAVPVLSVELKLLRRSNKAQLSRTEQLDIEEVEADQKEALWRVYTAGSLLTQYSVSPDLLGMQMDQTSPIMGRVKNKSKRNGQFSDGQERFPRSVPRKLEFKTVTIDSDQVTIVNNFQYADRGLKALLIEVDGFSLRKLIMNHQNIIAGRGVHLTSKETENAMETMIEDTRRFCIRSPILFRMTKRVHIINTEDIRYGINDIQSFKTLITSKGIKDIIVHSAAYYNSLDTGSAGFIELDLRPRFLQMIVLLLSLVNNEDLAELKIFLEKTYKLNADRRAIELLILKILPLSSFTRKYS
ncbi:MAG: hypothetical protein Q9169_005664 [Polycauliona sp. 2 TL-2023]